MFITNNLVNFEQPAQEIYSINSALEMLVSMNLALEMLVELGLLQFH